MTNAPVESASGRTPNKADRFSDIANPSPGPDMLEDMLAIFTMSAVWYAAFVICAFWAVCLFVAFEVFLPDVLESYTKNDSQQGWKQITKGYPCLSWDRYVEALDKAKETGVPYEGPSFCRIGEN